MAAPPFAPRLTAPSLPLPPKPPTAPPARLPARRGQTVACIYDGPGTDAACVRALHAQLRALAPRFCLQVVRLDAAAVRRGSWQARAALFVMPGGRDLPYVRALGGQASRNIRQFVAAGGRYFGSCAGAYFAADTLHFRAARVPAVVGRRPLAFFAGCARGPSQEAENFGYETGAGAASLAVQCARGHWVRVYNRGGCVFEAHPSHGWPKNVQVLARARVMAGQDGGAKIPETLAPVALLAQVGRGRALLWGAHPELALPGHGRTTRAAPANAVALLRRHLVGLLQSP